MELKNETAMNEILRVKDLKKKFLIRAGNLPWQKKKYVKVLNGIDFSVNKGEALGIVGESGCGKSTAAKVVMDIYSPTEGSIVYDSKDLTKLKGQEKKEVRKQIQYVFQDPLGALNPRIEVIKQIYEPLTIHYGRNSEEYYKKAVELLESVGMKESHGQMYPHQLSGGQRQRIVLLRAMVLEPELLICDEPISALDVSIQSQVVNLLIKIKEEKNITLLFISHDLSMIRYLCDRTVVMYMGNIVEQGDSEVLFDNPLHPYTKSLINAIPIPDPRIRKEQKLLEGEIPSLTNPPSGCRFHPRCPVALPECSKEQPKLKTHPDGRKVACFFLEKEGVNE
jgi:oligopeptide/dipeptide ABC transporter ATP-binding protein